MFDTYNVWSPKSHFLKDQGAKKERRQIKNTRCSKAKEIQQRLAEDSRGSNRCKPLGIDKKTGKIGIWPEGGKEDFMSKSRVRFSFLHLILNGFSSTRKCIAARLDIL